MVFFIKIEIHAAATLFAHLDKKFCHLVIRDEMKKNKLKGVLDWGTPPSGLTFKLAERVVHMQKGKEALSKLKMGVAR